jgi:hypothetical protein
MTAKVKGLLAELASMSRSELEELVREARAAQDPEIVAFMDRIARFSAANSNGLVGRAPRFNTGDLARLLKDLPVDPAFADDIEAGVRARREADESRTSPWES